MKAPLTEVIATIELPKLTKRRAIKRVKAHLAKHAPELLPILVVAWADMPSGCADAGAFADLHVHHTIPIRTGLDKDAITDSAYIIFDRRYWRTLDPVARRDLVDHEVAHLITEAHHHRRSQEAHGLAWKTWLGVLKAEEEGYE